MAVIDKVQAFIDKIKAIPSPIPTPSIPSFDVPFFAQGTYATCATVGMIGEAGPEVVMPLTRPHRMETLARELPATFRNLLAAALGRAGSTGPAPSIPAAGLDPTGGHTYNVTVKGHDSVIAYELAMRRTRTSPRLNGAR